MAIDTTSLDRDLDTITSDLPATITVGGSDYVVSADDTDLSVSMGDIGYEPDYDVRFVVRVAVLPLALVKHAKRFTYQGRGYRVASTHPSPDGVSYELDGKSEDT